jgi:hypothetical protein
MKLIWSLLQVALISTLGLRSTFAQVLVDPGFESYAVSSGGFLKPTTGAWVFRNDAGIVEPFSPSTSTAVLNTWSATLAPYEGMQYASSYAGGDWFDQEVFFPAAGQYLLSVYAASPSGTLIQAGGAQQLVDGDFRFAVGGVVTGPTFTPPLDAGWARYRAVINIPAAGNRLVGFHTTKVASYFINFDAFSLTRVPEPASTALMLVGSAAAAWYRSNHRERGTAQTG